jgi:hypothetical protein
MGKIFGVNYDFGTQLHSAVMQVHLRGRGKDWCHQTFAEATPPMIRAELATEDEIATLVAELKRLACDDSVLLAQARMPAAALAVK